METTTRVWAKMMVPPVYKKGDKEKPANYRAISLLSIPGKVFWKIISDRMRTKIEEALSMSQFGFRPGSGTVRCHIYRETNYGKSQRT